MDPVTQGTLGAAVALAVLPRFSAFKGTPWSYGKVAFIGAVGGLAPDLDVLIRSSDDALVAIKYHRHFTHSFAFIPIGGVVAALPWLCFRKWREHYRSVIAASTLGYATHALLDACTTYGTLLFWPFSNQRVSFSFISVVDLIYTVPLLAAVLFGIRRKSTGIVWAGLAFSHSYMALGAFQHQRARSALIQMATSRGHTPVRVDVFPSIANDVTWRGIYQSDGRFFVDKVRASWTGETCVTPGTSVALPPPLSPRTPKALRGYSLLHWFSDGWAAFDPQKPAVLSDLRYSFSPQEIQPIWGVRFEKNGVPIETPQQVETATDAKWVNFRSERGIKWDDLTQLWFEDGKNAQCF